MGVGMWTVVAPVWLVAGLCTAGEAGHLVLSVSDGAHRDVDGGRRLVPGARDILSVLDASSFPPRIVSEIAVRHGVMRPPTGVALVPDESLALVSTPTTVEAVAG